MDQRYRLFYKLQSENSKKIYIAVKHTGEAAPLSDF